MHSNPRTMRQRQGTVIVIRLFLTLLIIPHHILALHKPEDWHSLRSRQLPRKQYPILGLKCRPTDRLIAVYTVQAKQSSQAQMGHHQTACSLSSSRFSRYRTCIFIFYFHSLVIKWASTASHQTSPPQSQRCSIDTI